MVKEERITAVRQHQYPLGARASGALPPLATAAMPSSNEVSPSDPTRTSASQPVEIPAPSGGGVGWGRQDSLGARASGALPPLATACCTFV